MLDWREKVHPDKTEGLRIDQERKPTDVRNHGEQKSVRHRQRFQQRRGGYQKACTAKEMVCVHRWIYQAFEVKFRAISDKCLTFAVKCRAHPVKHRSSEVKCLALAVKLPRHSGRGPVS
jgi:hypothetical protein